MAFMTKQEFAELELRRQKRNEYVSALMREVEQLREKIAEREKGCEYCADLIESLLEQLAERENELERLRRQADNECDSCACKIANERDCRREALRKKREQKNGRCEYCDDNFKFWQAEIPGSLPNVNFCPMCGKPLKEVKQDER